MDKTNIHKILPLTPQQSDMLFQGLHDPKGGAYVEQLFLEVHREFNPDVFEKSLQWMMDRHEALRMVFIHEKLREPRQVILKKRVADFAFVDLSEFSETTKNEKREALYLADRKRGFDLVKEPLLRVTLIRFEPSRYWVLWSHHHIILDGWCRAILLKEFFSAYGHFLRGDQPSLEAVLGYSAFIEWFRDHPVENAKHFWKFKMEGLTRPSTLPFTVRNKDSLSGEHKRHEFEISAQLVERIKGLCKAKGVTISSFINVIWAVLLSRYSDSNDVVFGVVVSGRPPHLEQVDSMVGLFINTLPLRIKFRAGTTFWDIVQEAQQTIAEMSEHATLGLDEIKRLADVEYELYDHFVNFQNYPDEFSVDSPSDGDGQIGQVERFGNNSCAFSSAWRFRRNSLKGFFLFDVAIQFEVIQAIESHVKTLIEQVVSDPERMLHDFDILPESEKKNLFE